MSKSEWKREGAKLINYNELTKANLYLRDDLIGRLEKISNKKYIFTYEDKWMKNNKGGIGLSLPTDSKVYESEELLPFFDNLVPEGWLLSYAESIYKIDKKIDLDCYLLQAEKLLGQLRYML